MPPPHLNTVTSLKSLQFTSLNWTCSIGQSVVETNRCPSGRGKKQEVGTESWAWKTFDEDDGQPAETWCCSSSSSIFFFFCQNPCSVLAPRGGQTAEQKASLCRKHTVAVLQNQLSKFFVKHSCALRAGKGAAHCDQYHPSCNIGHLMLFAGRFNWQLSKNKLSLMKKDKRFVNYVFFLSNYVFFYLVGVSLWIRQIISTNLGTVVMVHCVHVRRLDWWTRGP